MTSNAMAAETKTKFTDVPQERWYYDEVYTALEYGIMNGKNDELFSPDEFTSRAQVAQTIYNMAGKPETGYQASFSDVKSEEWYASAVTWASQNKIVSGYPDGTFRPNAAISRQDIVVLLYRYSGSPVVHENLLSQFKDAAEVYEYAYEAMEWSVETGLLQGSNGSINPQDTATRAELAAILVRYYEKFVLIEEREYKIPILLYHHLSETEAESGTVLSPDRFEAQMQLLYENGYQTVAFEDLIAYVEQGQALPDKAVVITFDDGYYSNYEYAFPILQKYQFKATIFVIGNSIGKDTYKDTGYEMIPHFGASEIHEMTASGLISIHSHTYDMHQWAPYESGEMIRENLLKLSNESVEEYTQAVQSDVENQDKIFAECGLKKSNVLAFPGGLRSEYTNEILISCGYKVTVTTDHTRVNTLVPGNMNSLIDLGRMNVSNQVSGEEILEYCQMK